MSPSIGLVQKMSNQYAQLTHPAQRCDPKMALSKFTLVLAWRTHVIKELLTVLTQDSKRTASWTTTSWNRT